MFTEILRIKPVLDSATTKQMENNLANRFSRVAKRFGHGFKKALQLTVLGMGLGILNRLLNPIEALEEKIKTLLGQGTDIRELADRFNTSPGQLKRLQDVAESIGVKPDQLKEMLLKFAEAVETARRELANPFQQKSEATMAVKNFTGEKDLAEGFFKFLQSLKAEGMGGGRIIPLSENAQRIFAQRIASGQKLEGEDIQKLIANGEARRLTGQESRQGFERTIFGEQLFGAERRLVDADFAAQFRKLNEPSSQRLTSAVNKTAGLADEARLLQIKNANKDFLTAADTLNSKMIKDMEMAAAKEQERITRQLKSYDDLRAAADGIEKLKDLVLQLGDQITKGLGYLGKIADWIEQVKKTPLLRGIFGGKGN